MLEVATVDYHTAGEPFRIVVDGAPSLPGATVAERRVAAAASPDAERVRKLLCHEPRGHADMYGCFVVPPDDAGADLGVVFWHKDGYSTACGHGTMALAQWAVDSGRVAGPEVTIDVPSGRVAARISAAGVTFRNVPSFVIARDVQGVDVSYGGAIYASVEASTLGLSVEPRSSGELIAAGRSIKEALSGAEVARHPSDERLSGIYGTIIYEDLGDDGAVVRQRNVTVFADGEVDRSPCGSGTSARLALLEADGRLDGDRVLVHSSIVGTEFVGRVVDRTAAGVVTEVEGSAFKTGEHRFVLDPRDPVGTGFVLR